MSSKANPEESAEKKRTGTSKGLPMITVSVVGAGIIGYAIQGIVPVFVHNASEYLQFSVFWSTLFLVGAALGGIQQEVARATHPTTLTQERSTLFRFTAIASVLAGLAIALTSPLWAPSLFPTDPGLRVLALSAGVVGYAAMSALAGIFYGMEFWRGVAALTLTDAIIRLLLIVMTLLFIPTTSALTLAIVAPFPIAVIAVWLWGKGKIGSYTLDVPIGRLARNTLGTVAGATATGILTSGFPMLIGLTSNEPSSAVGALVFVTTLTRAPLVVPALALQSFLIIRFRHASSSVLPDMLKVVAAILGVSIIVAVGAYILEPSLLMALWGDQYTLPGLTCALIVLTAGLTAALCVSGAAALARKRHFAFLAGWVVAAGITVTAMLLPLPLEPRVMVAMAIGPIVGLLCHVIGLTLPAPEETSPVAT